MGLKDKESQGWVIDIDGSCCLSIFNNTSQEQARSVEFQKRLSELPIAKWLKAGVLADIQASARVSFITGRGSYLQELTVAWIQKNMGITSFDITWLDYKNYEGYIEDKKKAILLKVKAMEKQTLPRLHAIDFIEDDPKICDWLETLLGKFPIIHKIHKVTKEMI